MSQNTILGVNMDLHEKALRRRFQLVVGINLIVHAFVGLTWVGMALLFARGPNLPTLLLWILYLIEIVIMLSFLSIKRPHEIAVNQEGAYGETEVARNLFSFGINTDHALLTLYGILMYGYVLFGAVVLALSFPAILLFGGLLLFLLNGPFLMATSTLLYASINVIIQVGVRRRRTQILLANKGTV
jgi:hypothetical protein